MSSPAGAAIALILLLCGIVDVINIDATEPAVPALFYGAVLSLLIWGFDRRLRKRRNRSQQLG